MPLVTLKSATSAFQGSYRLDVSVWKSSVAHRLTLHPKSYSTRAILASRWICGVLACVSMPCSSAQCHLRPPPCRSFRLWLSKAIMTSNSRPMPTLKTYRTRKRPRPYSARKCRTWSASCFRQIPTSDSQPLIHCTIPGSSRQKKTLMSTLTRKSS